MALKFNCNICKDQLNGSMELRKANCGHVFHFYCIKGILEGTKIICPECKSDINGFHESETFVLEEKIEVVELQEQEHMNRMEEYKEENQQKVIESMKMSIVPMDNELEKTNTNEIQNMLHYIQMSLEEVSITISQKYASASEKYSSYIEKAIAEKDQIIKDLEQKLKASTLALEQEKEISKFLSIQHSKLREYMIATFMPDAARDFVKEPNNALKSNSSTAGDAAAVQKKNLHDQLKNGKSDEGDDDYEKVTFDLRNIVVNFK